jgi:hypothetical protein
MGLLTDAYIVTGKEKILRKRKIVHYNEGINVLSINIDEYYSSRELIVGCLAVNGMSCIFRTRTSLIMYGTCTTLQWTIYDH